MAARISPWDLLPEALRAAGYERDPAHLFGRLQRVGTWAEAGPDLSRPARSFVDERYDCALPRIAGSTPSDDGSTKVVLELADGARIEAVHMPRALKRPRVTICLSSQVGCAMGCTFCATARMGLVRHLTAHEIVGQLFAMLRAFGPVSAHSLNLVFMGMGEPLHNVGALIGALDVLCDERGLGVAPSRVTVSTVGHVPGIARLANAKHRPDLAVSVNEVTDDARARLMPVAGKWSLGELKAALLAWPRRPHEKILLEYVLLGGENGGVERADRLAELAEGLRHLVNVIPFNPWDGADHREPSDEEVATFAARLHARGCLVTVRRTRGRDARGACGNLVQLGRTRSEPRTTP